MLLFLDRFPSELSGGQLQRLIIAMALSIEPKLFIIGWTNNRFNQCRFLEYAWKKNYDFWYKQEVYSQ